MPCVPRHQCFTPEQIPNLYKASQRPGPPVPRRHIDLAVPFQEPSGPGWEPGHVAGAADHGGGDDRADADKSVRGVPECPDRDGKTSLGPADPVAVCSMSSRKSAASSRRAVRRHRTACCGPETDGMGSGDLLRHAAGDQLAERGVEAARDLGPGRTSPEPTRLPHLRALPGNTTGSLSGFIAGDR